MIKIENVDVYGWEAAVRGMRNPMNSWNKSDSRWGCFPGHKYPECGEDCRYECDFIIGENDLKLMKSLVKAGTDHRKFMRMINVAMDIVAPLYWWKEYDTYKVGTVANSCSTMHKIADKKFTLDDFSCEHIGDVPNCDPMYCEVLDYVIMVLNEARHCYLETKDKKYWWQMIQLLPSSYNQRRTVQLNYEVLINMYHARKDHKLDEWREFCTFIKSLPCAKDLILMESDAVNGKKI